MGNGRQTGFTLVEIMIAVAILAIIAAIAIPMYDGYVLEARYGAAQKDIGQIQLILDDLASDNDLAALEPTGYANGVLGVYLGAGGRLVLGDQNITPPGTRRWEDPWGEIYRYQRLAAAPAACQRYQLFSQGPDTNDASDDVSKPNDVCD